MDDPDLPRLGIDSTTFPKNTANEPHVKDTLKKALIVYCRKRIMDEHTRGPVLHGHSKLKMEKNRTAADEVIVGNARSTHKPPPEGKGHILTVKHSNE